MGIDSAAVLPDVLPGANGPFGSGGIDFLSRAASQESQNKCKQYFDPWQH